MSRDRDQAKLFMVNSRGLLSPKPQLQDSSTLLGDKKADQGVKLVLSPGRRRNQNWAKTLDSMSMSIRDVSVS